MRQRSLALAILLFVAPICQGARGKAAPAPPPPPPPPPSLLDAVKAVAVSAAAKLPSRAVCYDAVYKLSRASLQLASSAASASHKASAGLTVRLGQCERAGTARPLGQPCFALAAPLTRETLSLGRGHGPAVGLALLCASCSALTLETLSLGEFRRSWVRSSVKVPLMRLQLRWRRGWSNGFRSLPGLRRWRWLRCLASSFCFCARLATLAASRTPYAGGKPHSALPS